MVTKWIVYVLGKTRFVGFANAAVGVNSTDKQDRFETCFETAVRFRFNIFFAINMIFIFIFFIHSPLYSGS